MSEIEDRISAIENGFRGLGDAINALGPVMSKNQSLMANGNKTYLQAQDALEDMIRKERELIKAYGDVSKASMAEKEALEKLRVEAKLMTDKLGDARIASDQLAKKMKELEAAAKAPTSALGKVASAAGSVVKGVSGLGKGILGLLDIGGKYAQMMGGTAMSMQVMIDRTTKYNQSVFTLQKTSRLMGSGMGDMGKTFKFVQDNTTLSKNKFLELANAFNKTYLGAKPLPGEIAKFAQRIQQSFGPDVETTMQVAQDLLEVQKQFPAMFENINRAHDKMVKGQESGDARLIESAKQNQAAVLGTMIGLDYDPARIEEMLNFMEPMTKEEAKQVELNKKMQKTTQSSEDAILAAGKAGEEAFKTMADLATKAYQTMEKYPTALFASVAAMEALTAATAAYAALLPMIHGVGGALKNTASWAKGAASKMGRGGLPSATGVGGEVAAGGLSKAATGLGSAAMIGAAAYAGWEAGKAIDSFWGTVSKEFGGSGRKASEQLGDWLSGTSFGKWMTSDIGPGAESKTGKTPEQSKAIAAEKQKVAPLGIDKEWVMMYQKKRKAMGDDLAAAKATTEELLKTIKPQEKIVSNLRAQTMEYFAQRANIQQNLVLQNAILDSISTQIGVAEKYNAVTQDMLNKQVAAQQAVNKGIQEYISNFKNLSAAVSQFAGEKVELGVGKDDEERLKNAVDILSKIKEKKDAILARAEVAFQTAAPDEKDASGEALKLAAAQAQSAAGFFKEAADKQKMYFSAVGNMVEKIASSYSQQGDQLNRLNQMEMTRLETERAVYETSMLGFGPSVEMLQKQVDLTYEMLSVNQQILDSAKETLSAKYNMNQADLESIATARSGAEAMQKIEAAAGKDDQKKMQLLKYYEDAKKYTNERLNSEKKILELTKEMREGYLDAIRESSTNAKEFGKIISLQNMGITSMMRSVRRATGGDFLNTMSKGGITRPGAKGYDSRTGLTGRYGVGGPEFNNKALNNRWNDLYKGKESQQWLENMKAGKPLGLQNRPVGGAQVSQTGDWAGANREAGINVGIGKSGAPSKEEAKVAAAQQQAAATEQLANVTEQGDDKLLKAVKDLPIDIAKEMALLSKASFGIIGAVKAGNAPGQEAKTGEGAKTAMAVGTAYTNAYKPQLSKEEEEVNKLSLAYEKLTKEEEAARSARDSAIRATKKVGQEGYAESFKEAKKLSLKAEEIAKEVEQARLSVNRAMFKKGGHVSTEKEKASDFAALQASEARDAARLSSTPLKSYAGGTSNVPKTGPVMAHKGESIITAEEARRNQRLSWDEKNRNSRDDLEDRQRRQISAARRGYREEVPILGGHPPSATSGEARGLESTYRDRQSDGIKRRSDSLDKAQNDRIERARAEAEPIMAAYRERNKNSNSGYVEEKQFEFPAIPAVKAKVAEKSYSDKDIRANIERGKSSLMSEQYLSQFKERGPGLKGSMPAYGTQTAPTGYGTPGNVTSLGSTPGNVMSLGSTRGTSLGGTPGNVMSLGSTRGTSLGSTRGTSLGGGRSMAKVMGGDLSNLGAGSRSGRDTVKIEVTMSPDLRAEVDASYKNTVTINQSVTSTGSS
jgi:hypothetical protein